MKEIKLSNELISHRDFHKGYWYKSPNLDWYYFKREKRIDEIPSNKSFYSSLDQALFNFFKSKYMIRKEDFSKDKIKSILIKENISEKVINDVIELIESCEIARYTPASTDDMDKDYEKAVQILTNFENV